VMDGVQEGGKDDDGFDTDAAILTGELAALIPDLLEALGGELGEAAPATGAPGAPRDGDVVPARTAPALVPANEPAPWE